MFTQHLPYDATYKDFFSNVAMVTSLLRDHVRAPFVDALDLSTLDRCNTNFVTSTLHERRADVLWSAQWQNTPSYLAIFLEHQSQVDPWMPVRLADYAILFWQQLIKARKVKPRTGLPPVFSVVIHTGKEPWSAPLDIASLLMPEAKPLMPYQPQFQYFLISVNATSDAELAAHPGLMSQLMRLEKATQAPAALTVVNELRQQLVGKEYLELRRIFTAWLRRIVLPRLYPGQQEVIAAVANLEEIGTMLEENVLHWKDNYLAANAAQWREQYLQEHSAQWKDQLLQENIAQWKNQLLQENITQWKDQLLQEHGAQWKDQLLQENIAQWKDQLLQENIAQWKEQFLKEHAAQWKEEFVKENAERWKQR